MGKNKSKYRRYKKLIKQGVRMMGHDLILRDGETTETISTVSDTSISHRVTPIRRRLEQMRIIMPFRIYAKIMYWVDKADHHEVSGFGNVVQEGNHFTISEVFLAKQKNSSAETDIPAEAVAKANFESRKYPGKMRYHWHSHVQMSTFWSGTDHENIAQLGANGWFICSVFNQKREKRTCFISKDGTENGIFFDNLELHIERFTFDDETKKLLDKEYDEKVESRKYTTAWDESEWGHGVDSDTPSWNGWSAYGKQISSPKPAVTYEDFMPKVNGRTPTYITLCTKEYNRVYIDNADLNQGDILATKINTSDWLRHPIEDILNSAIDAAEDLIKTSHNIQPAYDLSMKQEDAPDEFILSLCNWAAMSQLEWDGLDDISKQTFFDQWLVTLSLAVVNVSNGGIRA